MSPASNYSHSTVALTSRFAQLNQSISPTLSPSLQNIQHKYQIDTINSYLIKPVQRITKYELLLQRLMSCCEESKGEVKEGYDLMCSVPKKANDAMHLSYLEELEVRPRRSHRWLTHRFVSSRV